MDSVSQVNLLDFYTRLMTVSAEGSQQSLAQTYLLLRLDALAVVALLVALIIAWYALRCTPYAERHGLQTWDTISQEDPRGWPSWQQAQQAKEWVNEARKSRKGTRR